MRPTKNGPSDRSGRDCTGGGAEGATVHDSAYAYVQRALAKLPTPKRVLELGSRNVNGSIRDLFPQSVDYCGIDLRLGDGVDVVADATNFGKAYHYDLVVCCEVLEHSAEGKSICANAYRVLAWGGVFLATAAYTGRTPHSGLDGGELRRGEHYRNVTFDDLYEWLTPFATAAYEVNQTAHDIYVTAVK
jgi:SAM-dependent methyltransferase